MKLFYRLARAVMGGVFTLGGIRILGKENIPDDNGLLIISNHVSYADPPAVSWAYPKQITYIAKESLARNFFLRHLLGALGAVFLEHSSSDMTAMRTAVAQLKAGRTVAIYPEGHRCLDQQMDTFKNGAAFIAIRCKVRVLPMALVNTGDLFRIWRRNVVINIGEPFPVCDVPHIDSQVLAEQTALYQQRVQVLFQEAKEILEKEGRPMRCPPKSKKR